ncbi:hypothetical protein [Azospira sp. I13]|uniref:hypothetical protein n=1 Tax=Azospira sp. I13 TaxID=1765050 RepID=UPI001057E6A0|nr:hypothetical protein [Azospira sp. I13]
MQEQNFNELAGRIEGLARVVRCLVATLEDEQLIDGSRYGESLRRDGQPHQGDGVMLVRARKVLRDIADQLETARNLRQ